MEEQIAELTAMIADLRKEQQASQQKLEALENQPTSTQQIRPTIILPRERKVRHFSGADSGTVEDFVEEIRAIVKARAMGGDEALDFVLSHLDSPAKEEVKLFASSERNTFEKVCDILSLSFGEKRSLPSLLKLFYERTQGHDESLMNFSHALRELFAKVTTKYAPAQADRDTTLRDQFIEGVRDSLLRKELKKFLRSKPSLTFLDVRDEAIRWSDDEEPGPSSAAVNIQRGAQPRIDLPDKESTALADILSLLKSQQEEISTLSRKVNSLETTPSQQPWQSKPPYPGPSQPRTPPTCYHCRMPGHIRRFCPLRAQLPPQPYPHAAVAPTTGHQAPNQHAPPPPPLMGLPPQPFPPHPAPVHQAPAAFPNFPPLSQGAASQGMGHLAQQ